VVRAGIAPCSPGANQRRARVGQQGRRIPGPATPRRLNQAIFSRVMNDEASGRLHAPDSKVAHRLVDAHTFLTDALKCGPWYRRLDCIVRPWRRCDFDKRGVGRMRRRPRELSDVPPVRDMAFVVHTLMQDRTTIDYHLPSDDKTERGDPEGYMR